jgi:hypothetical protein
LRFTAKWDADHAAIYPKGPQSPTDIQYIDALFEKRKNAWHVRSGETDVVECKLNYAVNGKIIRAIAGLANNKGGHILFGVKDKGLLVEGMSDDKFETLYPKVLNSHLVSFLDPVPRGARVSHVIDGKKIGALHVEKHERAPVIGNISRERPAKGRVTGVTRNRHGWSEWPFNQTVIGRSSDKRYSARGEPLRHRI